MNVVVVGAEGGFGKAIAKHLARKGHVVFATMRDIAGADTSARAELVGFADDEDVSLRVVELDVHDPRSVERAIEVIERYGPIDLLVNEAAPGALARDREPSSSRLESHAVATERVARAVLPGMHEHARGLVAHLSGALGRLDTIAERQREALRATGGDAFVVRPEGGTDAIEEVAEAIAELAEDTRRPFVTRVARAPRSAPLAAAPQLSA